VSHRHGDASEDRLIFLAEALTLVPFSETTLRRAIAKGELEAWRPNRDGKLIMWRNERRPPRPSSRRQRRTADAPQTPDPITLPDLA
jgi:hypothetical protein